MSEQLSDRTKNFSIEMLTNSLAEEILWISDEDLLAEAVEEGLDPTSSADEIRRMLVDASRHGRERRAKIKPSEY